MVGLAAVDKFDPATANDYWMVSTGFLTPSSLSYGTLGTPSHGASEARSSEGDEADAEVIKSAAALFPSDGLRVEQHFATSADGTKVPYFQISDEDIELDGGNPTLLDGYGGFEVSRTPVYSPVVGIGWLSRRTGAEPARRGVYVLANIRGG